MMGGPIGFSSSDLQRKESPREPGRLARALGLTLDDLLRVFDVAAANLEKLATPASS